MDDKLKDIINRRVPEYYQNETNLMEYLDVCAELFGELSDTIKLHDVYQDYYRVPESRLALLARKFAFNPPRGIPESMMRGIIRDIASIYSSVGTEQALFWVFRLLGWGVRTEYAWLLNPERYDPRIRDVFPEYYEAEGLTTDISYENSVIVDIGDGYKIGVEGQPYYSNDLYVFSGFMKIGRNELVYVGSGDPTDPFSPRNPPLVTTDFNLIDYRNFVYGKEVVEDTGTYFYGRTPFSAFDNLRKIRIIGEEYTTKSARYSDVVMKTPYVVVTIDEADYLQFTQPYEEDGVEYDYTESEAFFIAQTLIDYFMTDTTRPSPVRVILLAGHNVGEDRASIKDNLTQDATAQPNDIGETRSVATDSEQYTLTLNESDGYVIGTTGIHIGTPSFMPVNSINVIPMGQIGDTRTEYTYEWASDTYSLNRQFSSSDFVTEGTDEVTDKLPVRTPSALTILSSEDVIIQIRSTATGDFSDFRTLLGGTTYNLTSHDVNYIRFKSSGTAPTSKYFTVDWQSQIGYSLPAVYPTLAA